MKKWFGRFKKQLYYQATVRDAQIDFLEQCKEGNLEKVLQVWHGFNKDDYIEPFNDVDKFHEALLKGTDSEGKTALHIVRRN